MTKPTSEAKHTPGPWFIGTVDCNHGKCEKIVDKHGRPVFDGNSDYCRIQGKDVFFVDAYDADLQLAAAAPELLEACKAALDHLDGCSHGYPDELWDQLETAITKAEGGET